MLQIIQNDPEVPPGNITDHLAIPFAVYHPYRDGILPAPEQTSALIVMGGAMGANDDLMHPFLKDLKTLIRTAVESRIPYLGICLGGQLLAAAVGGKVVSNRWEERGTRDVLLTNAGQADPLFRGIPERFGTFQWHHDSFDIPAGGVLLASSAACPHQAFRIEDSAWGVQFHPEVTETILSSWCAWDGTTAHCSDELLAVFRKGSESYAAISRTLMHNFLAAITTPY